MTARIVEGVSDVEPVPSVVSIGFFDGVHRGHQAIVRRALEEARKRRLRSVVVTFDRHPMEVVRPGSQPKLLMTLARRVTALATLGCDLVVVMPFDDELRHLSPGAFVDRVLAGPLAARHVLVGRNFRFGHRAAGDVDLLSELGAGRGFTAEGIDLQKVDAAVVSSTEIRALVEAGDVERAARLLGRPHVVDGVVTRGDQRGAGLGFPTANLQVSRRVAVPARGIYAGVCELPAGVRQPCVTSVGVNPTFGGSQLRVESHLLDYDGDLYGVAAAVDFRHRLRDEQRFDSAEELVAQMRADVAEARRRLAR